MVSRMVSRSRGNFGHLPGGGRRLYKFSRLYDMSAVIGKVLANSCCVQGRRLDLRVLFTIYSSFASTGMLNV